MLSTIEQIEECDNDQAQQFADQLRNILNQLTVSTTRTQTFLCDGTPQQLEQTLIHEVYYAYQRLTRRFTRKNISLEEVSITVHASQPTWLGIPIYLVATRDGKNFDSEACILQYEEKP